MTRLDQKSLRGFARDRSGAVTLFFGIALPVMFVLLGAGMDFSRVNKSRSRLQATVDSAALMGASARRLANSTDASVQNIVNAQVQNAYPQDSSLTVTTGVVLGEVAVAASQDVPNTVMKMAGIATTHITAKARARVVGGVQATCLIALDPTAKNALNVDTATLSAPGCRVYSDSTDPASINVSNSGQLVTASTCSSGGFATNGGGTYNPQPSSDCPAISDPLANITPPSVSAICDATNASYKNTTVTLTPGVYCGGIDIKGGQVTLQSGTYIIKNGPLSMTQGALTGNGVTLFFTGTGSVLNIDKKAQVSLTAPSFGSLSGILLFEDRSVPLGQTHTLDSRYAANLLGTIYLPRSTLSVGTKGGAGGTGNGVASTSAWTIAVVRQLQVNDQQTLTLNNNYGATTVPPPGTLVSNNSSASLVQ